MAKKRMCTACGQAPALPGQNICGKKSHKIANKKDKREHYKMRKAIRVAPSSKVEEIMKRALARWEDERNIT